MTSHLIDFQGINSLNKQLIDELRGYLQEKESQLGNSILKSIHTLSGESLPPVLPYNTGAVVSLSDAVLGFEKNINNVLASKKPIVSSNNWESAAHIVDTALWEYTEVLEGCVTELFQQLGQVGFEQWDADLIDVVETIKQILLSKIENLGKELSKLESLFRKYKTICENQAGKKSSSLSGLLFWRKILDRSLWSYLRKTEKFLKIKHRWFNDRYQAYLVMKERVDGSVKKFKNYQIFNTFDESFQSGFKRVYQLLKLWKLNGKVRALPEREPVRALRSAFSMQKVHGMFSSYHDALRSALFKMSQMIKQGEGEKVTEKLIHGYRAELHTLGASIGKYREFFLGTHPNPYVRKKWGFAEWVVGPEPGQTRELLHLMYSVENLDKFYEAFSESISKKKVDQKELLREYREVQETLHEMGEPLTSRIMLRSRAEKALHQIQQMDELGSSNPKVVEYVGKAFTKALRADWQYHVLFEIPLFHQLFEIHQGVVGTIEKRTHQNRVSKFNQMIKQLNEWLKNRDAYRHSTEIESGIKEMKTLLQEFKEEIEKAIQEKEGPQVISQIATQLLEYRYIFGQFFYNLHQNETEGKLIRNQFLFVDQAFEAVENRLRELR